MENNVDSSAGPAVGYNALHNQVTGWAAVGDPHFAGNTAIGFEALANVTGSATLYNAANTALGYQALAWILPTASQMSRCGFGRLVWV